MRSSRLQPFSCWRPDTHGATRSLVVRGTVATIPRHVGVYHIEPQWKDYWLLDAGARLEIQRNLGKTVLQMAGHANT